MLEGTTGLQGHTWTHIALDLASGLPVLLVEYSQRAFLQRKSFWSVLKVRGGGSVR